MRKSFKLTVSALFLILIICASSVACLAEPKAVYSNKDTGYRAVIDDAADLLSPSQERDLVSYLEPLTEYTNVAVYTDASKTSQTEYRRAAEKRDSLFGKSNSIVVLIDMYLRKIHIARSGDMNAVFTNETANVITDNMSRPAHNGDYFSAYKTGLQQALELIKGNNIPSPVKHFSNAVVALMMGLIVAFLIAVPTTCTYKKPKAVDGAQTGKISFSNVGEAKLIDTERKYSPPSSDSGSSCGGSSCSSCGSSCSSCGSSCSSCGSSSF